MFSAAEALPFRELSLRIDLSLKAGQEALTGGGCAGGRVRRSRP